MTTDPMTTDLGPLRLLPALLALLVASPAALPAGGSATSASEVRLYDLSVLRPGFEELGQAEVLSPSLHTGSVSAVSETVADVEQGAFDAYEPDALVELLGAVLGAELEFEGRWMELREDDQLLVAGPAEVHERVQAVLGFLGRRFASREELVVDLVHLPARPDPALLAPGLHPPATVDAWLSGLAEEGGRAHRRSFALQLEPGRTGMVDLSREVVYVNDYDVEVAQAAFVHDPTVSAARVGTRILARGSAGAGGLHLALVVKHGQQLGELEEGEVALTGRITSERSGASFSSRPSLIHGLRLLARSLAVNTWLPDDRVLVLASSLDLAGGGDHQVVALRRGRAGAGEPVSALALGGSRLVLVDQEAIRPPAFELSGSNSWNQRMPSLLLGYQFWGTSPSNPLRMVAVLRYPEMPARLAWLAHRTEEAEGWVSRSGPWWFLHGPADPGGVPEAVPPETVALELVLSGGPGSPRPVRLHLTTRVGAEAFATLGVEETAIADFDVEVAQFASANDPVPMALFDGLFVRVRPARGADGRLHLEVQARAHLRTGEREAVELDGFTGQELTLPAFEHLFVDERLVLEEGTTRVVLGETAGGERSGSLSLEVLLR